MLGPFWGLLEPPGRLLGSSWGHLGGILGPLGVILGHLGDPLEPFGAPFGDADKNRAIGLLLKKNPSGSLDSENRSRKIRVETHINIENAQDGPR